MVVARGPGMVHLPPHCHRKIIIMEYFNGLDKFQKYVIGKTTMKTIESVA